MSSSKIFGVISFVAVVCLLVLVGLQVAEMLSYNADPSVCPATGPM